MRAMLGSVPLVAALGSAGCVPVLTSPEGTLDSSSVWVAPTNGWPLAQPPADLEEEGFSEGEVPPDMRLMDQNGQEVSLWQFYGSVVVVDVSTMWCGPCKALAAGVDETWLEYKDQGFMYLTVLPEDNVGEIPDQADLNEWATTYEITAPVLSDDQGYSYIIEPSGSYPTVMVLDRDMRVAEDRVEPAEDATVRTVVEALL